MVALLFVLFLLSGGRGGWSLVQGIVLFVAWNVILLHISCTYHIIPGIQLRGIIQPNMSHTEG